MINPATEAPFASIAMGAATDGLAAKASVPKTVMIDATYVKAHRTATSRRSKKGGGRDQRGRLIGRTKGGMNT